MGARYSPNTARRVAPHSPVVPPARAKAMDGSMMLCPSKAALRRSASAACTTSSSRAARHSSTSAMVRASTSGSTRWMAPSPPNGDGSDSVKRFTPTTVWSPLAIRRVRSAIDDTRRDFNVSMAANAPPSDNTSSSSAVAAAMRSSVRPSITCEPVKMSAYSNKSVSYASTCCMRSDHC